MKLLTLSPGIDEHPSLLVLILAYEAEDTVESVLSRIPSEIHANFQVEILVVDDASIDRTADVSRGFRERNPDLRVTVLRNRVNQGYGGNQKVGYTYAIENSSDFVVMLHGDGQYAPEKLPTLLGPLVDGTADGYLEVECLSRYRPSVEACHV